MAIPMGLQSDWLVVRQYAKVSHWTTVTNLGVRCVDGVAHIAELDLTETPHAGVLQETRREVLQQIYEHVVKQLAALELERS